MTFRNVLTGLLYTNRVNILTKVLNRNFLILLSIRQTVLAFEYCSKVSSENVFITSKTNLNVRGLRKIHKWWPTLVEGPTLRDFPLLMPIMLIRLHGVWVFYFT